MEEVFKEIEKHPKYVVDRFGNVYRKHGMSDLILFPLKPDTSNGYMRVDLDGKKEYIARLILDAFRVNPGYGYRVFYIDGDSMNCMIENLVWLTPSEIQRYSAYTIERRKELLAQW